MSASHEQSDIVNRAVGHERLRLHGLVGVVVGDTCS
jgi:hypothetical protein